MRGGQRDTEEVFGPYESYLDSEHWPSVSGGRRDTELVEVSEMAPQHAAASLAKLVRWARYEPAGSVALIDDIDMREEFVRMSSLGRHLAARALTLSEAGLHALFGDVGQGGSVEPRTIAAELVVSMGEVYPQWALKDRVELAYHLAESLDKGYVVKERSHRG